VKRSLRFGLLALGIAAVLPLLSPLYQRFMGPRRLRFPYLSRPIASATYAELAAKPGWAKSQLEVAPGIKLNGLVRRPGSSTAPWVLFYAGNDESQLERGQGFLIRLAGETNWGLAVFAYRGYDSSDGKSELASIRADAPEILARLCATEGVPASRVHLAGFSIGGHFSVQAARGAALRGQRAASLSLWAPVNDIVMYQPSRWEKLSAGEDYQTAPLLADVPGPVLVLQGSADSALEGPGQGHAIATALGNRATYQEFAGVDHVPLLSHEPALAAMRAFVASHVAPTP
jgi:pimeloyl-ACP methyl ester carboxylesterase